MLYICVGLEFESNLPNAGTKKVEQKQEVKEKEPAKVVVSEEESLEDRLRRLQGL